MANEELHTEPAHITVVGHKSDILAQTLHQKARRYPIFYKRVDWWDKQEGPMMNADITYPSLEQAAAFACANQACSLPVFEPDSLYNVVRRIMTPVN